MCYGLVSLCSNACLPNTWRTIGPPQSGFRHELRAKRKITAGERITINYEDVLLPNAIRRTRLLYVSDNRQ
jgi:hypothetical protein